MRWNLVFLLIFLAGCATSPLGHQQLRLLSDDQLDEIGASAYTQIRQESQVLHDEREDYVRCVVRQVLSHNATGESWQVTVFVDKTVNAFALPGGRIGVNSGLLRVAKTQDQLAAVIGHEVAHVTADHHNARLSAAYAAAAAQELALAIGDGGANSQQAMGLLGLGVQYGVIMPYGRSQESEADMLGLRYMARAGFDPRASIELWRNMEQASGGDLPAFLSTHPAHGQRIKALREQLPAAMTLYRAARSQGANPACG